MGGVNLSNIKTIDESIKHEIEKQKKEAEELLKRIML